MGGFGTRPYWLTHLPGPLFTRRSPAACRKSFSDGVRFTFFFRSLQNENLNLEIWLQKTLKKH